MTTFFKQGVNKYAVLNYHKKLLQDHYDFLKCSIEKNRLTCYGTLRPFGCELDYRIKVEYVAGHEPKTTILKPQIEPDKHIHMYGDHSICLHYPPDMKWDIKTKLYLYTIPWISEWIIFYEIYKVKGKWLGKESPTHISERDKNINRDVN